MAEDIFSALDISQPLLYYILCQLTEAQQVEIDLRGCIPGKD